MAYVIYKRGAGNTRNRFAAYQRYFMEIDCINALDKLFDEERKRYENKGKNMVYILDKFLYRFAVNKEVAGKPDTTRELLPKMMEWLVSFDYDKYKGLLSLNTARFYEKLGNNYQLKGGHAYDN